MVKQRGKRPGPGTALRWHLGLWDPWFLVWGLLLAAATRGYAFTRSRAEHAS
jgi:hypothetical protein